jgi:hypothetical protein
LIQNKASVAVRPKNKLHRLNQSKELYPGLLYRSGNRVKAKPLLLEYIGILESLNSVQNTKGGSGKND